MEFDKKSLKHKMGSVVHIKISMDDEKRKKLDLAPHVEDSEEPGVITEDEKNEPIKDDEYAEFPQDSSPDAEAGKQGYASKVRQILINSSPDHPASGPTLDSRAREQYMQQPQETLRQNLGAQFTENEGKKIVDPKMNQFMKRKK